MGMYSRYILVTTDDQNVLTTMSHYSGTNLIASVNNVCICWDWQSPLPNEFAAVQAMPEYRGYLQITKGNVVLACIIITSIDADTVAAMEALTNLGPIGDVQGIAFTWYWPNPNPNDLATAQALPGYKGMVELA